MEATIALFPGGKKTARLEGRDNAPLKEVVEAAGIEDATDEKVEYSVNGEPADGSTNVPDGATVVRSTVRPEGG